MPRIKSAKKRMRQSKGRTLRDKAQRSELKTAIKKVRSAPAAEAQALLVDASSLIDRAGRKNLIHRNAAARTKSRLAKALNAAAKA